jgi:hypothetical protein
VVVVTKAPCVNTASAREGPTKKSLGRHRSAQLHATGSACAYVGVSVGTLAQALLYASSRKVCKCAHSREHPCKRPAVEVNTGGLNCTKARTAGISLRMWARALVDAGDARLQTTHATPNENKGRTLHVNHRKRGNFGMRVQQYVRLIDATSSRLVTSEHTSVVGYHRSMYWAETYIGGSTKPVFNCVGSRLVEAQPSQYFPPWHPRVAPYSTVQPRTAPYSTVQHRTAPVQHRTAGWTWPTTHHAATYSCFIKGTDCTANFAGVLPKRNTYGLLLTTKILITTQAVQMPQT